MFTVAAIGILVGLGGTASAVGYHDCKSDGNTVGRPYGYGWWYEDCNGVEASTDELFGYKSHQEGDYNADGSQDTHIDQTQSKCVDLNLGR